MSIEDPFELERLREAGRIVRACLDEMKRHVRPGITTGSLNDIGARVLERRDARSAPMLVYGFPTEICISVNDEIVHGIPSSRILREGDLVKLDVTVEKDGFMADAAETVPVGVVTPRHRELIECARRAFESAMAVARAGRRIHEIGRAVQQDVEAAGFSVVRELSGHGIGRTIHEDPAVPNYFEPRARQILTEGLVFTVEPLITAGAGESVEGEDGWTILTRDGSVAAHHEHTIVITKDAPLILTAA